MKVSEQLELGERALAVPMLDNDAGAKTIKEYLINLAHKCWIEAESFSGKRPFGNSGWDHEIYVALGKAGMMDAKFDDDPGFEDDLISFDEARANVVVECAFQALGSTYT